MLRKLFIAICLISISVAGVAQTSDNAFRKPLKAVITDIENRYGVQIRYTDEQVKDRSVTYAGWRFTPDLDQTLKSVFAAQDLVVTKEADKKYKLQPFQYHLKTPEQGKEQLDYLASLYPDKASWEKRKSDLKACMLASLRLSPMPARPGSKPIITNVRTMDGYTIRNVAIEVLPGLYTCGSLYAPANPKGKIPVILNPDGHFGDGRYRADAQYRCAMQAKMGAMAFSYDLFAWGESGLQFKGEDHRRALAQTIQVLNAMRILDYLLSLKNADPQRVAITGGSGGGSQTMLVTALDDRITLSAPVVMVSSYHSGGCPCESGMGVHLCGNGTSNVEIAGMAAPKPQLVVSDGKDWTQHVPETEFPFIKNIYAFYNATGEVENMHLPAEGHDYGYSKRKALYDFLEKHFKLNLAAFRNKDGSVNETGVTIEKYPAMYVFGDKGEHLPANALKSFDDLQKVFDAATNAAAHKTGAAGATTGLENR